MNTGYVVRRVLQFLIVLWAAATINFILPRLAPGNPVRDRLVSQASQGGPLQEGIEQMVRSYNKEFGLDKPLYVQYGLYLKHVARLDFGYSIASYPNRVMGLIRGALPWTVGLLLISSAIAFTLGTFLGALVTWSRAPKVFQLLIGPAMALSAIPYYLLGIMLVYLLAILFPIFPLSGGYSIGQIPHLDVSFLLDILRHAFLPGLSIVLAGVGFWALGMRGMMITTKGEDYINFAEAKGLKDRRIFFSYAMRNAVLPQVTNYAINLGTIISGLVIVEVIFGYPGMGSLLFNAINGSDYFLIYGIVYITVLVIGLATLAVDLLYPILDPRISYRRA
ncbi:MAG: ABC transporter permease [Thermomicrobiales bacterium]